jgi:hypothetical protein
MEWYVRQGRVAGKGFFFQEEENIRSFAAWIHASKTGIGTAKPYLHATVMNGADS